MFGRIRKPVHVISSFPEPQASIWDVFDSELQRLVNASEPENNIPIKIFEKLEEHSYSLSMFHIFDLLSIMKHSGKYPTKEVK